MYPRPPPRPGQPLSQPISGYLNRSVAPPIYHSLSLARLSLPVAAYSVSAYQWLLLSLSLSVAPSQLINGSSYLSVAPLISQPISGSSYFSAYQWLFIYRSLSVAPLISQPISGFSYLSAHQGLCIYLNLSVAAPSVSCSQPISGSSHISAYQCPPPPSAYQGLPLLSQPISGSSFIPAYQWLFFISAFQRLLPYWGLSEPISLSVAPSLS